MANLIKNMSLNEQVKNLMKLGVNDVSWKDYDRYLLNKTASDDNKGGMR
jgi:hypothetical protein